MAEKKIVFMVDKLPYKGETSRLALTHAIASQTVEIHLEDDDLLVPVLVFTGKGVLNCLKNQKALETYKVTSLENHVKNSLLLDLKVMYCAEDVKKFGLTEDMLVMDAEDIGGDVTAEIVPFADIVGEIDSATHVMYF
jgi:sulfur relay (sulfurtransferase) DsrF/TusC family protein